MPSSNRLKQDEVIAQVVAELDGPIEIDVFLDRVLARWPTNAKNPKSALRNKLRGNAAELGVVFIDLQRKVLAPLSVVMRGVRFRHVIGNEDAQSGVLLIDVGHTVFMAGYHWQAIAALPSLQLLDAAGQVLRTHVVSRAVKLPALLGDRPIDVPGLDLAAWFRYHHVHAGDSLLVTIDEFDPPCWRIEHEPVARRDEEAIQRRNVELANILFAMLESAQDEEIWLTESVRSAHLQLRDPGGYPGDPWLDAIEADGRMRMDDVYIRYREDRRGLWGGLLFDLAAEQDDDLGEGGAMPGEPNPLADADAGRVYTFKVTPVSRKAVWRQVEIQGGQTLADLNHFLVEEFKHEWDHLGGFWKLVRRGGTKRYREIDLGTVEPFGGGNGADTCIAELDLEEGELLKWVFDFGDWFEYRLLLERVTPAAEAESGDVYPRVTGRNVQVLRYCEQCAQKGKEVVATGICMECSNLHQRDFMLCDKCAGSRKHTDHYVVEWVY